jgi:putative transposase
VRTGAGRKAAPERKGFVQHVTRPALDEATPTHVVVRVASGVPYLRNQRIFAAVRTVFARASEKGLRLLHFSVQGTHLHLIAEALDGLALGRGMQRLLSRIAMVVNGIARRRGKVFRDRYFRQDLRSPRQMRNALVYVLFNMRKHVHDREWGTGLDGYSSAEWFDGWAAADAASAVRARAGPAPVVPPRSWLARTGWNVRAGGPLRRTENVRSI